MYDNFIRKDKYYGQKEMCVLDKTALVLAIIGGINWGLVGLFRFDGIGTEQ